MSQGAVAPFHSSHASYSTMVSAPTPLQGPINTSTVAPTTVFAPYSAVAPATGASMLQYPSPIIGGTYGTLAGSTLAPTRAAPDQTLPLQARTLTTVTDASKMSNLIPSYAGQLGVGNYNVGILPITHTVHNILPPAQTNMEVVHCNPHPSFVKFTHDSVGAKKREKRLKKLSKTPIPDNRMVPFCVPMENFYRETDRLPVWYDNRIYHAGPAAPYIEKLLI